METASSVKAIMRSSLCHLIFLPELWAFSVLLKLTLKDIVRLDTAMLSSNSKIDKLESYRSLPPVDLPIMQAAEKLECALSWLFDRGLTLHRMSLQLEFLKSGHLQELLADNIHAVKRGVQVSCSDVTILSTTAYFLRQVLMDKVKIAEIQLGPECTPHDLPANLLPFHKLKKLSWLESERETNGHSLLSAIKNNPALEILVVRRHGQLPDGLFDALSLRCLTLREIYFQVQFLTDADLHEVARTCVNLTVLDITSANPGSEDATTASGLVGYITDAGICAIAQGCSKLKVINTYDIPLSAVCLTALFTHCAHLKQAACEGAQLCEHSIIALCSAARAAAMETLGCTWAVTAPLDAYYYQHAFSKLSDFRVFEVALSGEHTLCAALRDMPQLQTFVLCSLYEEETMQVSVEVLNALAQGASTVLRDVDIGMQIVGDAECSVAAIAQRNPHLRHLHLYEVPEGLTDAVLYAIADNCASFEHLEVGDAMEVTDASVEALAAGCPHLKHLVLPCCLHLTDRSVLAIAAHCPIIERVDVSDSPNITELGLAQLLQSCPRIGDLQVSPAGITSAAAQRLQGEMRREDAHIVRAEAPVLMTVVANAVRVYTTLARWWNGVVLGGHASVHPS
jgi:hypothetical protein